MSVHPTAIIDPNVELDSSVDIGPRCVIDGHVRIEAGCKLYSHVYVTGWTQIGPGCILHPNVVVGHEPQDLKYSGERSYCRIGSDTVLRENVTVHRGTLPESETVIGKHCYLMVGSHVAHNGTLGDHVILTNNVLLAGHVSIGDHTNVGGGAAVHQFCRIGERAMIAGHAAVARDVPPYALVDREGRVLGLNRVGLRRAGVPQEEVRELREVFRRLFGRQGDFSKAVEHLREHAHGASAKRVFAFLNGESTRGVAGAARSGEPEMGESGEHGPADLNPRSGMEGCVE
ncbi:MAG: acyl-ACP--UDP-N-acetylglucosamine O-acyltransferase [Phycisphaerae bacterium]